MQGKHALQFTPDDYISAALNLYLDVINVSSGSEMGLESGVAAGVGWSAASSGICFRFVSLLSADPFSSIWAASGFAVKHGLPLIRRRLVHDSALSSLPFALQLFLYILRIVGGRK